MNLEQELKNIENEFNNQKLKVIEKSLCKVNNEIEELKKMLEEKKKERDSILLVKNSMNHNSPDANKKNDNIKEKANKSIKKSDNNIKVEKQITISKLNDECELENENNDLSLDKISNMEREEILKYTFHSQSENILGQNIKIGDYIYIKPDYGYYGKIAVVVRKSEKTLFYKYIQLSNDKVCNKFSNDKGDYQETTYFIDIKKKNYNDNQKELKTLCYNKKFSIVRKNFIVNEVIDFSI